MTNPEEAKFLVSIFKSIKATRGRTDTQTLSGLCNLLRSTVALSKGRLPLLKLARFGERRSSKGSFRHDANIVEISGVEVEYDGEEVGFDTAVAKLRGAGLCFVAYTTPSHAPERPRWRVIAPCSRLLPPERRFQLVARLNGVLNGVLSSESFSLSQIFYFGSVQAAQGFQIEEVLEGKFIDQCEELDAGAIGKDRGTGHAADVLEQHLTVDWSIVYGCASLKLLEQSQPHLFSKLQRDLSRRGKLAERWEGGVGGLKDHSRSGRDRSLVQILRSMGYEPTEAIACAVAWGCSYPRFGRGLAERDKDGREINLERYWKRCWHREGDTAPISLEDLHTSAPIRSRAENPFPDVCRTAPGAVGMLASYFSAAMPRRVPEELIIPIALAAVAHMAQNRFVAGPTKASLQVYAAIVANTGVGKTELAKHLTDLLKGSKAAQGILESAASGPALLKRLHKLSATSTFGPTLLFLMDELGLKLQTRTSRSGHSHLKEMMDECISLYGRGNSSYSGKAYADIKNDIERIDRPNLSLVGFTTPLPLIQALTATDTATGLVNRFLLAVAEGEMPMKMLRDLGATPSRQLVQFARRIGDRSFNRPSSVESADLTEALTQVVSTLDPMVLQFAPEAERRIDELTDEVNELDHGSDEVTVSIRARARQQVIVVAAILAIGEIDTSQNELRVEPITGVHVEWAWLFVRWSTQNWVSLFRHKISANEEESAMNEIKDLLARVADYGPNGRLRKRANFGTSHSNQVICATGWMPKSLIGRELRGIRTDVRDRALRALEENEEIEKKDLERKDGAGRPTVVYCLTQDN